MLYELYVLIARILGDFVGDKVAGLDSAQLDRSGSCANKKNPPWINK